MSLDANPPPLKPLHADEALIEVKLKNFRQWTTDSLVASLHPDQKDCLKVREDGTILDGHHRIKVLRDRGHDVNRLPREIVRRSDPEA